MILTISVVFLCIKQYYMLYFLIIVCSPFLFNLFQKNPHYMMVALVLFSTNFLSLAPSKIGSIQIEKLEIIVVIIAYYLWLIKNFKGVNDISRYTLSLSFTAVVILLGAIMGNVTVNQPILLGFLYQTRLIVILAIFPFVALMKDKPDCKEKLLSSIFTISTVYSILLITQSLIVDKFIFLNYNQDLMRFGEMRISLYMLTAFSIFVAGSRLIDKIELKYVVNFFLNFVALVYVIQSRMVLFAVIASITVSYMLSFDFKKMKTYKKSIYIVSIIVILLFLLKDRIFALLDLARFEILSGSGNYLARLLEQKFYLQQVSSAFLGRGYLSPKSELASAYVSAYGYYDLTDIGIVGLYVTNGILGIVWFALISMSLLKFISYLKRRQYNTFIYYCFLLFSVITCYTLLIYYYNPEYLVLTFTLMELDKCDYIKKLNIPIE